MLAYYKPLEHFCLILSPGENVLFGYSKIVLLKVPIWCETVITLTKSTGNFKLYLNFHVPGKLRSLRQVGKLEYC